MEYNLPYYNQLRHAVWAPDGCWRSFVLFKSGKTN